MVVNYYFIKMETEFTKWKIAPNNKIILKRSLQAWGEIVKGGAHLLNILFFYHLSLTLKRNSSYF